MTNISEPSHGQWWGAYDNGEVWPVTVLAITPFGVRIDPAHESAPQDIHTLHISRIYDADFNRPRKVYS